MPVITAAGVALPGLTFETFVRFPLTESADAAQHVRHAPLVGEFQREEECFRGARGGGGGNWLCWFYEKLFKRPFTCTEGWREATTAEHFLGVARVHWLRSHDPFCCLGVVVVYLRHFVLSFSRTMPASKHRVVSSERHARGASEPSISCDKSLTKKESPCVEHTIPQTEDPTHARHDDHLLHFVPGRCNVVIFRAGKGERRMMTPSLSMLIIVRQPSSTSLIYVNNSMAEHR